MTKSALLELAKYVAERDGKTAFTVHEAQVLAKVLEDSARECLPGMVVVRGEYPRPLRPFQSGRPATSKPQGMGEDRLEYKRKLDVEEELGRRGREEASFVARLVAVLDPILATFPNVRLNVVPVPPRDYTVEINGTRYPATESGLYGVAPGRVEVRVVREGKPPCLWDGIVRKKEDQTVNCKL